MPLAVVPMPAVLKAWARAEYIVNGINRRPSPRLNINIGWMGLPLDFTRGYTLLLEQNIELFPYPPRVSPASLLDILKYQGRRKPICVL
jgi:hypothetical protein